MKVSCTELLYKLTLKSTTKCSRAAVNEKSVSLNLLQIFVTKQSYGTRDYGSALHGCNGYSAYGMQILLLFCCFDKMTTERERRKLDIFCCILPYLLIFFIAAARCATDTELNGANREFRLFSFYTLW